MQLLKKLNSEKFAFAGDLGAKAIAEVINSILGILTLSILTRSLTTEDYTVVNQIVSLGSLVTPILLFKFNSAFCVFLSGEQDKSVVKSRFCSSLILSVFMMIAFSAVCLLFSKPLSSLMFDTENYSNVVFLMGAYFSLLSISEISQSLFRAMKQLKKTSMLVIFKSVMIFAVFLTAKITNGNLFDAKLATYAYIVIEFIMALTGIILVFKYFKGVKLKIDFKALKVYYKYALPLMPYAILSWVNTFIGRFIITHLMDLKSSGIYSFNSSLIMRAFFMTTVISYTIFPYVAKFWNSGEKDKVVTYLEKAFNIGFLFGLPLTCGIVFTAPTIVGLLSGGNFGVNKPLLFILCIGMIFQMMYAVASYLIDLSRKTMWYNIIFLITSIINVGLNYLLIPYLGMYGAALALLANQILLFVLTLIIGQRTAQIKVKISYKNILISLAGCVVMSGVIILLYRDSILNFIMTVAIAMVVYFAVVFGLSKLLKIKIV